MRAILFVLKGKDTMKTIESIVCPMVRVFEEVDLPFKTNLEKAISILAPKPENSLTLWPIRLCTIFKPIYQKLNFRRMQAYYE